MQNIAPTKDFQSVLPANVIADIVVGKVSLDLTANTCIDLRRIDT